MRKEDLPLWWSEDEGCRVGWCVLLCPLLQVWEQPDRAQAVSSYNHFKQGAGFPPLCVFPSCVPVPSLSLPVPDLAFQTLSCQGSSLWCTGPYGQGVVLLKLPSLLCLLFAHCCPIFCFCMHICPQQQGHWRSAHDKFLRTVVETIGVVN